MRRGIASRLDHSVEPVVPLRANTIAPDVRTRVSLWLARVVLGVGAAVVAAVGMAPLVAPTVRQQFDPSTIVPDGGFAFVVTDFPKVTWLHRVRFDDGGNPSQSGLRLYEDSRLLGPPHTAHQAIRERGRGVFSHWAGSVWFSSSDGSDPRSNGRLYRVEAPAILRTRWFYAAVVGLAGMTLASMYLLYRSKRAQAIRWAGLYVWLSSRRGVWRTQPRIVLALAALCLASAGALAVAEIGAPTYTLSLSPASIQPELGVAHFAAIPFEGALYRLKSDSGANPSASTLQLFEDGNPLGPAHSMHGDVRAFGQGRFSHWGDVVRFSASDNSNPVVNGRRYTIRARRTLSNRFVVLGLAAFCAGTLLLATWLRVARADTWSRYRQRIRTLQQFICTPLAMKSATEGALVVAGAGLGMGGVVLGWIEGGGTQIGLELARFFPLSDALAYQSCGTSLAAWGSMGGFAELCARRVLYISMLASLFPAVGWSSQNVLIVQGLLSGLASTLFALQIARLMGAAAALAASAMLIVFVWEFTLSVFMTEVAGFVMGTLGLTLLLAFTTAQRALWLFAGMAFLSAGMMARVGAILVVPAALAWVGIAFWRDDRRWRYLAVGLAGATVGPLLQVVVVWLLGADPTNTGGNFSATLYGMSTGSRRWKEAYEHFRAVFETQSESDAYKVIYAAAIQNIVNHPGLFLQSLAAAVSEYWRVFFGIGALQPWQPILWTLFAGGLLRGIVFFRTSPPMALLAMMFFGEVATTPLVGDGGLRVLAASIAVRFAICAGGLHSLLRIGSRAFGPRELSSGLTGGQLVLRVTLGVGIAILVMMVLPGLRPSRYLGFNSVPPTGRCSGGLVEVVSRIGKEAITLAITGSDEELKSVYAGRVNHRRLTDDSRYRVSWYARELTQLQPPVTLVHALDRSTQRSSSIRLLAYEGILAETDQPRVLCVDPSHSVRVADGSYSVIREIKPLLP